MNPNQERTELCDWRKNTCGECEWVAHGFCRRCAFGYTGPGYFGVGCVSDDNDACPAYVPKAEPPAIKYGGLTK